MNDKIPDCAPTPTPAAEGMALVQALNAGGPLPMTLCGNRLLRAPLFNKDAAFTEAERDAFGLRGLLPQRVARIEEQVQLEMARVERAVERLEEDALHERVKEDLARSVFAEKGAG